MRTTYWDETIREAGRETLDAARRHRKYALIVVAGLLVGVLTARAVLGDAGGRNGILAAMSVWLLAVAALTGALFAWKLISIPPRRHTAQQREISRLTGELRRASDVTPANGQL